VSWECSALEVVDKGEDFLGGILAALLDQLDCKQLKVLDLFLSHEMSLLG